MNPRYGATGTVELDGSLGGSAARGHTSTSRPGVLNQDPMRNPFTDWRGALAGLAVATLGFATIGARPAQAAVVVIHGGPDEPPPPREERVVVRRGYAWQGGHYEWRHRRYVWVRGHHVRERRGHDWAPGRWERHDDHYDWHRGEWHPHR